MGRNSVRENRSTPSRRAVLARTASGASLAAGALAGAGVAGTAGCLGTRRRRYEPPARVENPPAGVYRATATSRMATVGVADAGPFRVALAYGYPVRFWEVVGEQTYQRSVEDADDVHLVALAWDPETGVVLPDAGVTVEVARDGDLVAHEAVYAMLSQRTGFHYGDNVALDGDGRYDVTVSVGGLRLRRTGAFADRFEDPASHAFAFEYARSDRDALRVVRADDPGARGAFPTKPPRGVSAAVAPDDGAPGDVLGRATSADVVFEARVLTGRAASARVADTAPARDYLAVVTYTPHNRLRLPGMGLRATVERDDGGTASTILDRTVDPDLGYHYGTGVDDAAGIARVLVETLTPPQVARHAGYETAFLDVETVTVESP